MPQVNGGDGVVFLRRGYTRSGTTCYKYTYTSLTGRTCPAGYTLIYSGLYRLCRKKLTTTTTATGTTTTCTRTITIPATIPRNCPAGYNPVLTVGKYEVRLTSCRLDRDTATNRLGS